MGRQKKGLSTLGRILLLLIIISTVIAAAFLNSSRALRIGAEAVTYRFLDRPDKNTVHQLPIVDIYVNPDELAELEEDMPWTGGVKKPVVWKQNGIDHKGNFRYRGLVSATHYLGAKKSFRLDMKGSNPYRPIRSVNVINPKSLNMLNNHMALWIGGYMGVAVPFDELVYVRMNGEDYGVMELFEQIDGRFEEYRNINKGEVPVFKGDYPPLVGRELPEHVPLWKNADNWDFKGKAERTKATENLRLLISLMRAQGKGALDTLPVNFADSLGQFIDVPDMLRYCAALKVLNTMHIDNYHNQWLVQNKSDRFYPILWDPLMMFPPKNTPWYPIHDALAYHILRVPEWRVERDRLVYGAIQELHVNGAFKEYFHKMQDRLRPSLMADPNKTGAITTEPNDVFPYSSVHAAKSSDNLLSTAESYWSETLDKFKIQDLSASRRDSTLSISWRGNSAIRLTLGRDSLPQPIISTDGREYAVTSENGVWSCLLVPRVVQKGADEPNQYSDRSYYEVLPAKFNLRIAGYRGLITISNAITDEQIQKK